MNATNYTQKDLVKIHLAAFHTVSDNEPRGTIVGQTWFLRVNQQTVLVTPYSRKHADGHWTDHEHTTVL